MGDFDYLFGPISHKYCLWFYILSVIAFVYFVLFIITGLYIGLSTSVKGFKYYIILALGSSFPFFMYFQNRLLYNMCNQSI